jgi:surfeit locus 1 family protein
LRFTFTPGFWPTIAAAALVSLTIWLGHWQTERGDEKQARQDLLEQRMREPLLDLRDAPASADDVLYRRVRASGEYLASRQIFIDNQVFEGRAGFNVVTPLRLDGSGAVVLVVRGWIERTQRYPEPPPAPVAAGHVTVAGIAALPPKRYLELAPPDESSAVWQNLSIERFAAKAHEKVFPFLLVADYSPEGFQVLRERPDAGVERHREYSLTWYAIALTTFTLWLVLNVRRRP